MQVLGLPAHPLVVHFGVVLMVVLAFVGIALAVSSRFSRWLGWGLPVLAVITGVAALLTKETGEMLGKTVTDVNFHQHEKYADAAVASTGVLVIACLLWWVLSSQAHRVSALESLAGKPWVFAVLRFVLIIGALAVLVTGALTGHTGAVLTWQQ